MRFNLNPKACTRLGRTMRVVQDGRFSCPPSTIEMGNQMDKNREKETETTI